MKIKSVSGLVYYVKDLAKTVQFYESLGFDFKKREPDRATGYSNWFWIDFITAEKEDRSAFRKEAKLAKKGTGLFIYLSVDDVDKTYKEIIAKSMKPLTEPRDSPLGNREFVVLDPDGTKLVFFKRK